VGDRFFAGGWQLSLMKRMKKRLTETADHYRQMAAHSTRAVSSALEQDDGMASASQREFYDKLEKYASFMFFLLPAVSHFLCRDSEKIIFTLAVVFDEFLHSRLLLCLFHMLLNTQC
jgi:hypothetical protein